MLSFRSNKRGAGVIFSDLYNALLGFITGNLSWLIILCIVIPVLLRLLVSRGDWFKNFLSTLRTTEPMVWAAGAGFLYVIVIVIPGGKTTAAETVMRDVFRLPDSVSFETSERPQAYSRGITIEGNSEIITGGIRHLPRHGERPRALDAYAFKP